MSSAEKGLKFSIRGRISNGLGEGAKFTQIDWVRRQFIEKLGIDPYPGTLNLKIMDKDSLKNLKALRTLPGIEIKPDDPSFCMGRCYHVMIEGKIKGAIVIPLIEGYPEDKVELIAQENLKEKLLLKKGDLLEIEVL